MAGLAPRTRWPEPRRGPPGRVADPGRAASTGRVPSCIGRTSDPRRAAGPRPVPGPRPDRRLTTARPTAHPSSTGSATGSAPDPPTLLRRPLADTVGKDARDRWKMLLPHAPGGRSHEMARRRLFWGVCVGRVVLLWRPGARACPNLPQRRSGPELAAKKSAEYQRFFSRAPARSGPLWQIWTNCRRGPAGEGIRGPGGGPGARLNDLADPSGPAGAPARGSARTRRGAAPGHWARVTPGPAAPRASRPGPPAPPTTRSTRARPRTGARRPRCRRRAPHS